MMLLEILLFLCRCMPVKGAANSAVGNADIRSIVFTRTIVKFILRYRIQTSKALLCIQILLYCLLSSFKNVDFAMEES